MAFETDKKAALKQAKKLEIEDKEIETFDQLKKEDKEFKDEALALKKLLLGKKRVRKSPNKKLKKAIKKKNKKNNKVKKKRKSRK